MICRNAKTKMPDLLLDPASAGDEVRAHVESCEECGRELRELQATMSALDAWDAPEISPFFDGRMAARLREEQETRPAGWLERMRARLLFGEGVHVRSMAAAALVLMMAVGGGVYADLSNRPVAAVPTAQVSSPVIRDLQSLDENAVVFQQLSSLDDQQGSGSSAPTASHSL